MKIAIVGGGAAGCFAAANLPYQQDIEVALFEKQHKLLQKVKASGGGRCNVTHACFHVPDLLQRYPRGGTLLKKTLYQFSPEHTIQWFSQRQVTLKEEPDGRMFPTTDDSQTIIDALVQQMQANGTQIHYQKQLQSITKEGEVFTLTFSDGMRYVADKVLIACGGFPKVEQYDWLRQLGHSIQTPVPSLFTFNMPKHPITALMGLSVPMATVKIEGTKISQQGPLLITHWGMSGPAILKTSAVAARVLAEKNYHFNLLVQWLADVSEAEVKSSFAELRSSSGKQFILNSYPFDLPKRLWQYLAQAAGVTEGMRWGDMPAAVQNKLINSLLRDTYGVQGKTTFKEEFVTCGGIATNEVDGLTMESKLVSNLYFAGEILDVDGVTGGFNFQHAWSSGYIAAQHMLRQM
jgi:predicted Rossmann fold flavoprotein